MTHTQRDVHMMAELHKLDFNELVRLRAINADMLAALQSIQAKADEIFERLAACQGKGRPSAGTRDICLHKAHGIISNARAAIARATQEG